MWSAIGKGNGVVRAWSSLFLFFLEFQGPLAREEKEGGKNNPPPRFFIVFGLARGEINGLLSFQSAIDHRHQQRGTAWEPPCIKEER